MLITPHGQPTSGRVMRTAASSLANGRIVERWGVQDVCELLQQIAGDEMSGQ